MSSNIRQIIPATGWRVVSVRYIEGECTVTEAPVACFALLEPPYPEREDGPEQAVVPMLRERGSWPSRGIGLCDLVLGDWGYWEHQRLDMEETFVGYLNPDEDQSTPWVQEGIATAREYWLSDLETD